MAVAVAAPFRLPCAYGADVNAVQQYFNAVWQNAFYVERIQLSQVKNEKRGVCIWTVCFCRINDTLINDRDLKAIVENFANVFPPGSLFVNAGRYKIDQKFGVQVKYAVYGCNCQPFFGIIRRGSSIEPRIFTEVFVNGPLLQEMVQGSEDDDNQNNSLLFQLYKDYVGNEENQHIKIFFYEEELSTCLEANASELFMIIRHALQS